MVDSISSDVEVEEQQLNAKAALQDQTVRNDELVAAPNKASKALLEFSQGLKAEDEKLRSVKAKFTEIYRTPESKRFQEEFELFCREELEMLPIPDSENGAMNDLKMLLNRQDKLLNEMKNDHRQLTETCETLKKKLQQEGHDKYILKTYVLRQIDLLDH